MKKSLIITSIISIVLFVITLFVAYDKHFRYILPKEYKKEIEILLEQEIPKATQEIDGLYEKIENEKDPFDKVGLIEMGVDIVFFDFYWRLVDTTEKYTKKGKIREILPPGDNVWEIHEALIPYFKNNKINTSNMFPFIEYGVAKQKEIEKHYAGYGY